MPCVGLGAVEKWGPYQVHGVLLKYNDSDGSDLKKLIAVDLT